MDRNSSEGRHPISPHSLITDESAGRRRRAGAFYLAASALIVGVAAAFIWLFLARLSEMGSHPVQLSDSEVTATTLSAVETPSSTAVTPQELAVASTRQRQAKPAPSINTAAPTPTKTPTVIPYLDEVEAVAGLGGALLWNGDGSAAGRLPQGSLFTASERSADGQWLYGKSEDGLSGWAPAHSLIVFDVARLAPRDVVVIPITPTPVPPGADQGEDASASEASLPTVTAVPEQGIAAQDAGAKPRAQINIDEGRLNVRAGPGPTYQVIAKAYPAELYRLLARSDDSVWVQLEMPDVPGGIGWVAAEYVDTGDDIEALPVSEAVSAAPAYDTGAAERAGDPTPENSGLPPMKLGPPSMGGQTSADAQSVTGLTGKLVIQQEWGGSIYIYDLETGELRLLSGGFDPALSPDGSQVAFTRDGGENGIYLVDVQGSPERLIFSGRERLRAPKFSPDGQYIVFERGDESTRCKGLPERCRASVPSPDGDLPKIEIQPSLARVRVDGSDYWDPMDLPYARVPDWGANGIVYQSRGGLQITQNEPSADTKLVYFDILKQYEMDPDWQPGGDVIAFHRRESSHWEIFAVNPDGSGLHALTRPEFLLAESLPSNVSPAWSPDGKHIVFLSNRTEEDAAGDEWGVWVMDADGSNQRRLPVDLPLVYTYVSEQMVDWGP